MRSGANWLIFRADFRRKYSETQTPRQRNLETEMKITWRRDDVNVIEVQQRRLWYKYIVS
jgi:hypothetical protein